MFNQTRPNTLAAKGEQHILMIMPPHIVSEIISITSIGKTNKESRLRELISKP